MLDVKMENPFQGVTGEADFRPMMEEAATHMMESVMHTIHMGGRPAQWPTKRDGTVATLMQSGRLFHSIRKESGDDFFGVFAGRGVPYAQIHHYGGVINHPGSKKAQAWKDPKSGRMVFSQGTRPHQIVIPARPYMMFQDEDIVFLNGLFRSHMMRYFGAGGEQIPPST